MRALPRHQRELSLRARPEAQMSETKPIACMHCGATQAIAQLVSAAVDGNAICWNLARAVKCEDEYECVRRQNMKMDAPGHGWDGPRL